MNKMLEISLKDWKKLDKDSYKVVDIRDADAYNHGCIPGALNIPEYQLEEQMLEWNREKKLILCCTKGRNSLEAARRLQEAGYDAYSLTGGYACLAHLFIKFLRLMIILKY